MAARKLAANVWVDGVLYAADSDVPAEVAKSITNPKAWGSEPDAEAPKARPAKAAPKASSK